jgi:hypothetical protein
MIQLVCSIIALLREDYNHFYGRQNISLYLQKQFENRIFNYDEEKQYLDSYYHHEKDPFWKHNHKRFNALGPFLKCPNMQTFGTTDGSKTVCMPSNLKKCVVVSIGSDNNWEFETSILKNLDCKVHTLDCTIDAKIPDKIASSVTFHQKCLVEKKYEHMDSKYISWPSFLSGIGLSHPPTILKMDIEGHEWSVISELVRYPHLLPESISMEFHYQTQMKNLKWRGRFRTPYEIAAWMDYMFTRGGYILANRIDNPFCLHCSEIVIARISEPIIIL